MNKVLSDFVNNSVLFFGSFTLILIGVIVILVSTYSGRKKKSSDTIVKNVVEEHPLTFDEINEKKEESNEKVDIESILEKMQKQLDSKEDEIYSFEKEQEEKSIISYQELLKATGKEIKEEPDSEVKKFVDQIKGNSKEKKFKGSEFISPIYGRVKAPEFVEKPNTPIIKATRKKEIETLDIDFDDIAPKHANEDFLENTLNLEPLKQEMKYNDEFLKALKEFRKNLE